MQCKVNVVFNVHFLFQTFPFFGVEPTILNEHGEELEGEAEGYLVSFRAAHCNLMHLFGIRLSICFFFFCILLLILLDFIISTFIYRSEMSN